MPNIECPGCSSKRTDVFYELESVPTNSCILLATREEALEYPKGNIYLSFCDDCGFIWNSAFVPERTEYSARYEETQGFSPTFKAFHQALAQHLIDRYDLHEKVILEIGCGKGEFLNLLCKLGPNSGIGFDPGYHADRGNDAAAGDVRVITDFYSGKYASYKGDFVACKMTLEHIPTVSDFIGAVRNAVRDSDSIVFFQIPEALRILTDCAYEDIYYEHCSYFTGGSIARLFRRHGFEVLTVETEYDAQYLTIEARLDEAGSTGTETLCGEESREELRDLVGSFAQRCTEKIDTWRKRLRAWKEAEATVVLWGSGSKAVSFLHAMGGDCHIENVVDINPYRHDHFMPGSGQRIVPPAKLQEIRPDVVVVMNRVYVPEIHDDLHELGLNPEVHAL